MRHPPTTPQLRLLRLNLFAGMPPTVGFMGKFFIFNAAIANQLYSLVIIGVIGSSISLYYYLRVIVKMFMENASNSSSGDVKQASIWTASVITGAIILTILLGTMLPEATLQSLIVTSQEVSH